MMVNLYFVFNDRQADSAVAYNSRGLIQPSLQMRWIRFPDLIWENDLVSICIINYCIASATSLCFCFQVYFVIEFINSISGLFLQSA